MRRKGRCAVLPRLVLDASALLHCAAQASAWKERIASTQVQSLQLPVREKGAASCGACTTCKPIRNWSN